MKGLILSRPSQSSILVWFHPSCPIFGLWGLNLVTKRKSWRWRMAVPPPSPGPWLLALGPLNANVDLDKDVKVNFFLLDYLFSNMTCSLTSTNITSAICVAISMEERNIEPVRKRSGGVSWAAMPSSSSSSSRVLFVTCFPFFSLHLVRAYCIVNCLHYWHHIGGMWFVTWTNEGLCKLAWCGNDWFLYVLARPGLGGDFA